MEAIIIAAIIVVAILWHFYQKNEAECDLRDKHLDQIKKAAVINGYDTWDVRLEGHVDCDEKKRRQSNTKMLEGVENTRLETPNKNTEVAKIKTMENDQEYEYYHQAALAINVKIKNYTSLKNLNVGFEGISLRGDTISNINEILSLDDSSFCSSQELSIRIIKFFKGYTIQLSDFVKAVNLAMSNKKITKFDALDHHLLSGKYTSQRENLISYFLDFIVLMMGESRRSCFRVDNKPSYSVTYSAIDYDDALAYFVSRCIVIGIAEKCALKVHRRIVERYISNRAVGLGTDETLWGAINCSSTDIERKTIKRMISSILKSKDESLKFSRFYNKDPKIAVRTLQCDLFPNISIEDQYLSYAISRSRKRISKEIIDLNVDADTEAEEALNAIEGFSGTGLEYEAYMHARIERDTPFNVELTKSSGDHGADLVIRKTGYSAVVQLKLYSTPVGNKAVQEAYTAKQHYHVGHAFVVTNSSYTRAAYEVAETTGVMLFQDEEFIKYLKSDFFY